MLTASDISVRVGARLLLSGATFRVAPGDKIGLVGRNGAGKTTLTRILSGEGEGEGGAVPAEGEITRVGSVGYLPQDPRTGDLDMTAADRVLSARGLDEIVRSMRAAEARMATHPDKAMKAYTRAEARFTAAGGYAAEAEAARVTASLGLPDRLLAQPLRTLSGGQRRRVELARILFAGHDTLLLDEPTNHLDADSVTWLRDFLVAYKGGLIVISHDVSLLERTVNRVFALDANRAVIDVYNVGWQTYLTQRDAEERRRKRERANAERKASSLLAQADRMRASAGTAMAAKNMARRAHRMLDGLEEVRRGDKAAKLRLPDPAPSGRTPLTASGLSKSYGSLEIFTGVDLAVDRGSRVVILGFNGAGKTTLLRILAGEMSPDTGMVVPGHGLKIGYYAQEHETLDTAKTVREHLAHLADGEARRVLGSFLFSGDDVDKPVGVLSGGEKTRLALATLVTSGANVLLLDEPTNNLDPVSRKEILAAIESYRGAIVLVTHDEGAVEALSPDRVLLLPDGVEDLWTADYADLVSLA
ncbi:ABC-F family ATP-binding cassette domain-containing protein [Nonomuraea sp. NPDC050556]|uniref:ABC-F family ATP-binding cassette domain-containing protein n=1 Tax=Nonomuraea sp. NPDC050556 TaxID=3364369 RepID=UPI0037A23D77